MPTDTVALFRERRQRKGPIGKLLEWFVFKQPAWLVSLCLHALLLVTLALILLPLKLNDSILLTMGSSQTELQVAALEQATWESTLELPEMDLVEAASKVEEPTVDFPELELADLRSAESVANVPAGPSPQSGAARDVERGGIAGRANRRAGALQQGATKESEAAVDRALDWLVAHQNYDGSWNFDLRVSRCKGKCTHSGTGAIARNAATALGVLPFLGAGITRQSGRYRSEVTSAIRYLLDRQDRRGGYLEPQGTMYSHGLVTLALCELVALEKREPHASSFRRQKKRLREAAQRAIDYVIAAQHHAGGWRYEPGQSGDTSVVGWQAMALQSGRLAGLNVPDKTMHGITKFLDAVSSGSYGATYGYQDSGARPGTSAVGLLCRMYLGWDRTHPGISAGVDYLNRIGPSSNNLYYDYYATQVMHHYQGDSWEQWNSMLRDHLVQSQARQGHAAGSWYFDGDFGSDIGGRLYLTAMATMTLEVYYRHLPIYQENAVTMGQELVNATPP